MNNLIIRSITGILFVAVMVGCILFSPVTFAVLFALITGLATWEFCTIVNRRGDVHVNRLMCSLGAMYLFVSSWCFVLASDVRLFIPYLLAMLYLFVGELYRKSDVAINNWAFAMMSQLYVAAPFALLNIVEFWSSNPGQYVLALFIFLWCSDTGAYCTGSLIGRHKLFPSVSPAKTWEGSIGGAVLTVAASQLFCVFVTTEGITLLDHLFWGGFALTVVVFGTWGDLVESLLKRRLSIKDSGQALPGHGGWLDRFDSSLLAIPAMVVYFLCW